MTAGAEDLPHGDRVAESVQLWKAQEMPNASEFELMTAIFRTHQMMVGKIETALREFDLGLSRYLLITTLFLSPGGARRMSHLGRDIMVHPTTVTLIVDQLVKQHLVERVPHPTDRRVTLVRLTETGRALAAEAGKGLARMGFGLGDFDADEASAVVAVFERLRRSGGDIAG